MKTLLLILLLVAAAFAERTPDFGIILSHRSIQAGSDLTLTGFRIFGVQYSIGWPPFSDIPEEFGEEDYTGIGYPGQFGDPIIRHSFTPMFHCQQDIDVDIKKILIPKSLIIFSPSIGFSWDAVTQKEVYACYDPMFILSSTGIYYFIYTNTNNIFQLKLGTTLQWADNPLLFQGYFYCKEKRYSFAIGYQF